MAEGRPGAQPRDLGEIDASPAAIERLLGKLARTEKTLHV